MIASRKSYRKGMVKVAIAYPAPARIALQSLSIHILGRLVDEDPDAYPDFVFLNDEMGHTTKIRLRTSTLSSSRFIMNWITHEYSG